MGQHPVLVPAEGHSHPRRCVSRSAGVELLPFFSGGGIMRFLPNIIVAILVAALGGGITAQFMFAIAASMETAQPTMISRISATR